MLRLLIALALIFVMIRAAPVASADDDIVFADFENATYGSWTVTGDAFGPGPAQGALPNQMPVSGYLGHSLVNSFFHGDGSTGTLTSPLFTINRSFINFLIGGGNHPGETCINLLVGDRTVRTTSGPDSEHLDWASWDVSALRGKSGKIQIVDTATGGWGHICVDQITLSDSRKAPVIVSDVLYDETYRPQFHFTAKTNWLNDPNGLVYYAGEYHLFFQHNPSGIDWGNMTWGHAVSKDLVHWKQLPDAIKPDKLGTIFSGSAVVDWHNTSGFGVGGEPPIIAMYTAAGDTSPESKGAPFTQCIAYSNDKGRTFTKYGSNPVLPHIVGGNRDPKLVWFKPTRSWTLALYLDGDEYGLFTSPNLKQWKQIQTIKMPGSSECPDFFPIKVQGEKTQKWVLTGANGHYIIGDYDGALFKPDGPPQVSDTGANYYAVQTYSDIPAKDGRRIQIAWMSGGKYPEMPFNQQMSFPCELTLRRFPEGLRLCRNPVKEIQKLYFHKVTLETPFVLAKDERKYSYATVNGIVYDLAVEFEPGPASDLSFDVKGAKIAYNSREQTITCLGRTTLLPQVHGQVKLRLLVDRTSIELFGNDGRVSMTSCFVPSPTKNSKLSMLVDGDSVHVKSFELNPMRSIWGTELFPASMRSSAIQRHNEQ